MAEVGMRRYTWMLVVATALVVLLMWSLGALSLQDVGNNLIVGLVTALITVSLVHRVTTKEKRILDGLWASEALFSPLMSLELLIRDAARWLLRDDPPGIEAEEKWGHVAEELATKRERLAGLLPQEILLAMVELEDELRRVDNVTARGDETRKTYAQDLFSLWGRFRHLMDRMLPPKDELRKDFLAFPVELKELQKKYALDERGRDRKEAEETEALLRRYRGKWWKFGRP